MSTKKGKSYKRQASEESGEVASDDGGRRGTKDDSKKKDGKTQNTIIQ